MYLNFRPIRKQDQKEKTKGDPSELWSLQYTFSPSFFVLGGNYGYKLLQIVIKGIPISSIFYPFFCCVCVFVVVLLVCVRERERVGG